MNINHSEYQKNLKKKTAHQLRFALNDCRSAISAYPEGIKAGYYQDEIHYINMELKRRIEV